MQATDIVLARIQQADGALKTRPSLVLDLVPPFGDFLLCGISTQLDTAVAGLDEVLLSGEDDFPDTGLRSDSVIRSAYLFTIPKDDVKGVIGRVSQARYHRVLQNLADYLLVLKSREEE
jgi:mRNA interferase MazF